MFTQEPESVRRYNSKCCVYAEGLLMVKGGHGRCKSGNGARQ